MQEFAVCVKDLPTYVGVDGAVQEKRPQCLISRQD
jgi:hypothetical protein